MRSHNNQVEPFNDKIGRRNYMRNLKHGLLPTHLEENHSYKARFIVNPNAAKNYAADYWVRVASIKFLEKN